MLIQGADVFLSLPEEADERILHQGMVTEVGPGKVVGRFAEPIVAAAEARVFLHGEVSRNFMQQTAMVQALLETAPHGVVLAFSNLGKPISAESRVCYRVSVVASSIHAALNSHDRCTVQDVSATGFGVISHEVYTPGEALDVTLSYDGCFYSGQACIQSVKARSDGMFRYGLHAIEPQRGLATSALHNGLSHISAAVQRQQLRRLARA